MGGNILSGIIGIYSPNRTDTSQIAYYGLYALQHRGQASTGIAVNNNGFVDYHKEQGLVNEVFSKDIIDRLMGNIAIGHVRYASSQQSKEKSNVEPLVVGYRKGALALSLDGSIVNAKALRDELEDKGVIFQSTLDAEVIANLIARYHRDGLEEAIIEAIDAIKGSYSIVMMNANSLIAARDPHALRPMVLGRINNGYIIASETCAFDTIGAEFIRDINAGEMIVIDENGVSTVHEKKGKVSHCLFEFIYFARPDSQVDYRSIYTARIEIGRQLARESPVDGDIVIGAPDSGVVSAVGYAEQSKIPYRDGLIKNRYVGRTFIEPTQGLREQGVKIKLNVLKDNVNGKKVVLVDDSIVRGTTVKRIIDLLRNAGAKEVHVRVSSPPVRHSCYLGVDMPTNQHLMAAGKTVEEIRKELGADSLYYISLDGLRKAIGGDEGFCVGCFTGQYPVQGEMNL
ncbi:MAG: amidophosphoribosyltransferase [Clostridiales bacterium]|nr:amidophosphoribosyltransferase [Clostridiales bacterium]